jgi:hypothetical protein
MLKNLHLIQLVLKLNLAVTQLAKKFPAFMEPENPASCSQKPTMGLYSE